MGQDRRLSDEQLNAFVDGQLDTDETARVLAVLGRDEAVARRVCELRSLRELVRYGYQPSVVPVPRRPAHGRLPSWGQVAAGVLLLVSGALAGWVGHGRQAADSLAALKAMYLDQERVFQTVSLARATRERHGGRILLHISSSDPAKLRTALDTVERLLSRPDGQRPVEVEVVANAGGLALLRADVSPFARRVHDLEMKFDNLTFLACQTALDRLRKREHITPDLLPEAIITPSALEEILNRLQEGWMYVSV